MTHGTLPFDNDHVTLSEALLLVTAVLEDIHQENLRLQERIGSTLAETNKGLIEDLQLLDRQAQVTSDLVTCLQLLVKTEPQATKNTPISREKLFRLDATRNSFKGNQCAQVHSNNPDLGELWV